MSGGKEHLTRLTPNEERAMDAAARTMLDHLTVDGAILKLSLVRVTAALASQTAGYASATGMPFDEERAGHLRALKERHYTAGIDTAARNMKTIGNA